MTTSAWLHYQAAVGDLTSADELLEKDLRRSQEALQERRRAVDVQADEVERRIADLDARRTALVSRLRAAGQAVSISAAPCRAAPPQFARALDLILADMEAVADRADREVALIAGHRRAQARLERDAADAEKRRAELAAHQVERERRMSEARARAAAERARMRPAEPAPETTIEPTAASRAPWLAAAVIGLVVLVVVLGVLLL